ncbi:predicted protein [Sclerotinia sclerotiorum 1980 UF-70]|uniref:Uncharacterized protein n=1 Tax=Sclerotinia sclerotiorum (strain ATCC 18683 / 1980 / Ss-1) TaxID=665079 RepID=A7F6L7_SCLS1|nr:predicted protein [Sclerotinia sclerotiorum 1980 UF-70]EDN98388.1 predicted protein [Sclerotinia sclerotiorum 1980 UF-70]
MCDGFKRLENRRAGRLKSSSMRTLEVICGMWSRRDELFADKESRKFKWKMRPIRVVIEINSG